MNEEKKDCCVCGEKATSSCSSCECDYCDEHYQSVVMTGNCCRGNELNY